MPRRSPRSTPRPARPLHARLRLELLEDRSLLDAGTQLLVTYASGQMQTVPLAPDENVNAALAAWQARPGVRSAEVNQTLTISRLPNDTRFPEQWGLNNTGQAGGKVDADIDAPEAWDSWTGGTSKPVAVIDTGIDYTHPDLYRNVWINQAEIPASIRSALTDTDGDGLITFWDLNNSVNIGAGKITDLNGNGYIDAGDILKPAAQGGWANGVSDDGDAAHVDDLVGWNFVNNTNDPFDDNGHGTLIAGIIGATGNNGAGVTGVNWKTQVVGLKFLGANGSGSLDGAVAALRYALANGIPISNNSWGGATYSQALYDAVRDASVAGHIFVAAAGNAGTNNDAAPNYPASFGLPNVVSVAATTRLDTLAPFSNFGVTSVDLGAPGQQILSTAPGGKYTVGSGTSTAAAQVAGAAALLWSRNPGLTYSDVISTIFRTVQPLPSLRGRVATGGRLDLGKVISVGAPGAPDTHGAYVVSMMPDGAYLVRGLRVTFSEAMNPGTFTASDIQLTGPGGDAIPVTSVRLVPGSGGTEFDVSVPTQVTPGQYTLLLGPDVRDVSGNPMDQNGNGVNGEADDAFVGSFSVVAPSPGPGPYQTGRPGPKIVAVTPNGTASVSELRVSFDGVIDPTTFTPGDVFLTGTGMTPITITAVRPVDGSANTQFDVVFGAQTLSGTYMARIGPDIRDTFGTPMDQNGNGIPGEMNDAWTGRFTVTSTARVNFANNAATPVQYMRPAASSIYVGQRLTVGDVDVRVNLLHPFDGKVILYLRAPNGKMITLAAQRGGAGKNYTNTTFDDQAATAVAQGSAPVTGSFRPDSPLSVYNGTSGLGYWTLFVYSTAPGLSGTLLSWGLSIQAGAFGGALSLDSEAPSGPEGGPSARLVSASATSGLESVARWLATGRSETVAEEQTRRPDDARKPVTPPAETTKPRAEETAEPPRVRKALKRDEFNAAIDWAV